MNSQLIGNKTIAAIATAQGQGGIGVIRISGSDALMVADKIFKTVSGKSPSSMKGYTASYGHVYSGDTLIDEAVLLVFKAPYSYTGEDVAEISCHGGAYVTKAVLRAALENGASTALAGEFTKRAFLNGKIDLIKAESVMNIISAKSKNALSAANASSNGALRKKIDSIKNILIEKAAHLSAWADYPEDDIPELSCENLLSSLKGCCDMLRKLISDCDMGKTVCEGIDTVIAGKPNSGKSTLMNMISGYQRSIVADIAGTTRDIIEETALLGDYILRISDTAGLRETDGAIEKIGVELAKKRIQSCELVLAVFDSSQKLCDNDLQLIESIGDTPCIAVINKSDLPNQIDMDYIKDKFKHSVYISAKNSVGKDDLVNALEDLFSISDFDPSSGILSGERQRDSALRALSALNEAVFALENGITLDAVTASIEYAIQELLELTGERAGEEIVNNIFSRFCVGK